MARSLTNEKARFQNLTPMLQCAVERRAFPRRTAASRLREDPIARRAPSRGKWIGDCQYRSKSEGCLIPFHRKVRQGEKPAGNVPTCERIIVETAFLTHMTYWQWWRCFVPQPSNIMSRQNIRGGVADRSEEQYPRPLPRLWGQSGGRATSVHLPSGGQRRHPFRGIPRSSDQPSVQAAGSINRQAVQSPVHSVQIQHGAAAGVLHLGQDAPCLHVAPRSFSGDLSTAVECGNKLFDDQGEIWRLRAQQELRGPRERGAVQGDLP